MSSDPRGTPPPQRIDNVLMHFMEEMSDDCVKSLRWGATTSTHWLFFLETEDNEEYGWSVMNMDDVVEAKFADMTATIKRLLAANTSPSGYMHAVGIFQEGVFSFGIPIMPATRNSGSA